VANNRRSGKHCRRRRLKNLFLLTARECGPLMCLLMPLRDRPYMVGVDATCWDSEHSAGKWDYLSSIAEEGHHLIIASYMHRLKPNSRVLDVGCGQGVLNTILRRFGYANYIGIDISETAIAFAARHGDAITAFHAVAGERFDTNERFDVIIFNESLYYFAHPLKTMEAYSCFLAEDGIFIVSMAFSGFRTGLLKLKMWLEIESRLQVIDETSVSRPNGETWIVKAVAASATATRLRDRYFDPLDRAIQSS